MWGVAAVQHELVAVGIAEEGHVADAGVERVAAERDASPLELLARALDVGDAQGDRRGMRPPELLPDVGRVEEIEADVLAELELGPCVFADRARASPGRRRWTVRDR
jgi:hypothetical protein